MVMIDALHITDIDNPIVCLERDKNAVYPTEKYFFSPSKDYPEYPFTDVAPEKNGVYALVRRSLKDLGMDEENYGTPSWNPLKQMLHPGQTVVVKPNFVMHENENRRDHSMECLVTHPSCIRAIVDYCVIALTRKDGVLDGKIIIADAPMQGCKFDDLVQKVHLDALLSFYKNKEIAVSLIDLRQYQTTFNRNKVITGKRYTDSRGVIVHLGNKSMHCKSECNGQYQVSDYDQKETLAYHHGNVHDYELAEEVLRADLLINFSKPKTHRLAGITGALKNMVGAAYNKATLPHRTAGAKSEGGDAYLYRNWMKKVADCALTAKIRAENHGNIALATMLRYCYGVFLVAGRALGKDHYYIGSWYGNDTIWRTMVDLNYAVTYADKNGILHNEPQRKILYLADMITAGQRNGPVSPEPKQLGIICGAFDGAAIDSTICRIMGFQPEKIPYLRAIWNGDTWMEYREPLIVSNQEHYNGKLNSVDFPQSWRFLPHDAWKDVLGELK